VPGVNWRMAAHVDVLAVTVCRLDETHAPLLGWIEGRGVVNRLDLSDGLAKPISDVPRVDAYVVVLPVLTFAVGGGGGGRFIRGVEIGVHRHLDQCDAIVSEDARQLTRDIDVLGNVLQNM
jgi:hypothetical protein